MRFSFQRPYFSSAHLQVFSSSVKTCVCILAMFSLFFFHDVESFCSNISRFFCCLLFSSYKAKIFFETVFSFFWSESVGLDTFKKEISSASETLKSGNLMTSSCHALNMVQRFWSRSLLWVDFLLITITFAVPIQELRHCIERWPIFWHLKQRLLIALHFVRCPL